MNDKINGNNINGKASKNIDKNTVNNAENNEEFQEYSTQKNNGNKYHKIGVIVIIAAVVMGFMAFGIMDVIHSISSNVYIAKVGEVKISNQEFDKAYRQQASKLVSKYGSSGQLDKIITSQDFKNIILSDIINKKLVVEYVKSLGINITYDMLTQIVKTDPRFANENGFDTTKFNQYLAATDSTTDDYMQNLLYEISSNLVLNNVISRPQMQDEIANEYLKFNQRQKNVAIYEINEEFIKKIEPAFKNQVTSEKIIDYYSQNKLQYLIPQQRQIEYINLFDGIFNATTVSTQDAKSFYDSKIAAAIKNSEKRSIYSALFNKEKDAKLALNDLNSGVSFASVVKKYLNLNLENTYLQNITKDDFEPNLSNAIFSLKAGQISSIIKTSMGYYIIKLDKITKDTSKTFANLESEIKDAIKFDRACTQTKQLFNKVEDFSISNPSFDALKKEFNLTFSSKTISAPTNNDSNTDQLTTTIFNADESSQYPLFIEDATPSKSCNYYIAKIQKVTPESYKSFDSVKGEIEKTLLSQNLLQKLLDTAKSFSTLPQKPSATNESIKIADKDNKYFSSPYFYTAFANLSPQNPISMPIIYNNKVLILSLKSQQKLDEIKISNADKSNQDDSNKQQNSQEGQSAEISKSLAEDSYSSLHKTLFKTLKAKIYNKNFEFIN